MGTVTMFNGLTEVEVDTDAVEFYKEHGWVEPKRQSKPRRKASDGDEE